MATPPKASTTEEENKQNSPESSQHPSISNEPEKSESADTLSVSLKPISFEEETTSLKIAKKNEQLETSANTNTDPRKSGCPQNLPNKSFGTMTYSTEKPGLVDLPQQPSTTKSTEPEKSESVFTSSSPPKLISSEETETKKNELFQTLANANTCPRKSRQNSRLLARYGLVSFDLAENRNSSGAWPTDLVIKMNEETVQTPVALLPKSDIPDERMASNEQLVIDGHSNYTTSWPKVGEIKPGRKRGTHYSSSSSAKATDNKNLQTVKALPEKIGSSNRKRILTPTTNSTEHLVTVVDTSDHGKNGCTANLSTQMEGTESYLPSSATKQTSSRTTPVHEMKKNEEMVQIVDAIMTSTQMTNNEQLVTVVNTSDPTKCDSTTNLSHVGGTRADLPSSATNKTSCPETTADHDTNVDALPPKSDFSDEKIASNERSIPDGNSYYNTGWPKVGEIKPGKKRGGHYPSFSSAKTTDQRKKKLQTTNALPEKVDSSNAATILTPTTRSTEKLETVVDTSDHGKSGCTTNLSPQMGGTKAAIKQTSSSTKDLEMKNEDMVQTVDTTMISTQTMNNEQLVTVVDASDPTKSGCITNLSQIGGTRIDLPSSAINQTSCTETTTDHDTKMKEEMIQTVDTLPENAGIFNATMTSTQPTNAEQSVTDWVPQMDHVEIILPPSATNQNSSSETTAEQEMARTKAHILNVLYGERQG